jgi:hypothetical protein
MTKYAFSSLDFKMQEAKVFALFDAAYTNELDTSTGNFHLDVLTTRAD